MWPFSSSSQQLQQQQQQSQSKTTTDDLTKWQVDVDGENALPPTVTACAPIVMALQDFMAQSVLNQEQADTLMRELWDCADNSRNSKRRTFKVLAEEALMYARFRPVDFKAVDCIAQEPSLYDLDANNSNDMGSLKQHLVRCVGAKYIPSWTDRSMNEQALHELHAEVKALAKQVNSCQALLAPYISAISLAENSIAPMFRECMEQESSEANCQRDHFGLVQSKTKLDLKKTYKLKDTCAARERTLLAMQRLLDGEIRKNMLFKHEEEKAKRSVM